MPRARVQTASGRWAVVHASRLNRPGVTDQLAIILEEARPSELAPVILAAYGLTDREREIAQLMLRGYSTAAMAAALVISPDTVQDHCKAIFDKVGVHSRKEVVARLFAQQYAPHLKAGHAPSPNGWFLATGT
jgi:DNA-binding CsgD family transcriptional regulator